MHLAAVVVQLPVRAAGQPGDLEALGVAVLRRLAVSTVDGDDAVTKKQMFLVRITKMLKLTPSLVSVNLHSLSQSIQIPLSSNKVF